MKREERLFRLEKIPEGSVVSLLELKEFVKGLKRNDERSDLNEREKTEFVESIESPRFN